MKLVLNEVFVNVSMHGTEWSLSRCLTEYHAPARIRIALRQRAQPQPSVLRAMHGLDLSYVQTGARCVAVAVDRDTSPLQRIKDEIVPAASFQPDEGQVACEVATGPGTWKTAAERQADRDRKRRPQIQRPKFLGNRPELAALTCRLLRLVGRHSA